MTRHLRILALLILPTVMVAGWAMYLAAERASQPAMRIAITGYDPRDLLRGHYLQFRLDLPAAEGAACACLHPDPGDALRPSVVPVQCTAPPPRDCGHFIGDPGRAYRYYAPEERALALQGELMANPGSASVLVHFHGDGAVSFSDISTRDR